MEGPRILACHVTRESGDPSAEDSYRKNSQALDYGFRLIFFHFYRQNYHVTNYKYVT